MKRILFHGWIVCHFLLASRAGALDFVRQIQVFEGVPVVIDMPVNQDVGELLSDTLVADISVFQLWASYTKADRTTEILKLDEQSVGTFLPKVSISISSEDPHFPVCTRADRPYSVSVAVDGMLSGGTDPEYSKSVLIQRDYQLYSPETYHPTNSQGEYVNSRVLRSNGTFVESPVFQILPVAEPTRAVGIERFSAHMLPEAGANLGQLASAEITIWPVATAEIYGIQPGALYRFATPKDVYVSLRDAYPRSRTYVQIYKGPQQLGTEGTVIPGSVRHYGQMEGGPALPQNTLIPLGDLSSYIGDSGEYTIEVLTVTPFNGGAPERLAHVSFSIDRTIEVRAMVVGIEQ